VLGHLGDACLPRDPAKEEGSSLEAYKRKDEEIFSNNFVLEGPGVRRKMMLKQETSAMVDSLELQLISVSYFLTSQ
jgi:hypothetical protein